MLNESAYRSMEEALEGIKAFEKDFVDKKDRRAVFATTYLSFTQVMAGWIEEGRFEDRNWMTRYGIAFANLYREAVLAYPPTDARGLPKAWRLAFDTSTNGRGLIVQDLVLGMNAHINRDLPFALASVSIDPDRESRFRDHSLVNEALQVATDPIQERIARLYAPGLGLLDGVLGPLDEQISAFSLTKARDAAWEAAVGLVNSRNRLETTIVGKGIEGRATVLGRLVLAPTGKHPWLLPLLRHLESKTPWWEVLHGDSNRPVVS